MVNYLDEINNNAGSIGGSSGGSGGVTGGIKGLFGGGKSKGGNTGAVKGQSKIAEIGQGVNTLVNSLSNLTSATKGLAMFQAAPTNKFIRFVRDLKQTFGEEGSSSSSSSNVGSVIQAIGNALNQISNSISSLSRGLILYSIPSAIGADHAFISFIHRLFSPEFLNSISYKKATDFNNAVTEMSRGLSSFAKTLMVSLIPIIGAAVFMEASGISPGTMISLGVIVGILAWSLSKATQNVQSTSGEDARRVSEILQWGSLGLVAVGLAFMLLPDSLPSPPSKEWSLKTGLAMAAFTLPFVYIANRIQNVSMWSIAQASVAIGSVALAIASAAAMFVLLPDSFRAPPAGWSLKAGLALLAFTVPFVMISAATSSVGWQAIGVAAGAIISIAGSLVAAARILQFLPDSGSFRAPPYQWSLKTGLALLAFTAPLIGLATLLEGGMGSVLKGAAASILISGIIVSVAYIFRLLPAEKDLKTLDPEWAAKTSLGILAFGAVVFAVGFMVQTLGYVGFLAGAAALPIVALSIVGMAYVFKLAPDNMFEEGGFLYKVADVVSYFFGKISAAVVQALSGFLPNIKKFLKEIIPVVGDFISKVAEPLGKFANLLMDGSAKILKAIGTYLDPVLNNLVDTLKQSKELIVGVVSEIGDVIKSLGKSFVNSIKEMKNLIVDVTKLGSENVAQTGASLLSMAAGIAAVGAALAGAKVTSAGADLAKGISNVATAATDTVAGWFGAETDKSNETPKTAIGVIKLLANKSGDIKEAANSIKSLANSIKTLSGMKNVNAGKIGNMLSSLIDKVADKIDPKKGKTLDAALVAPIGSIAGYEKPIKRIADNMSRIANSITDVLKQIKNIPESKFETFNDLIYNTNELASSENNVGSKLENVKEFIVKLDDTSLESVSEKMDVLVTKMNEAMSGDSKSESSNIESRVGNVENQQVQMVQMLQQINENLSKISRQLNQPLTVENL
jgi:hypothetical protein